MTATAIEKDQEQGNERAEGRTGIKAEGGGRADLGSDHVSLEGGSLGLQVPHSQKSINCRSKLFGEKKSKTPSLNLLQVGNYWYLHSIYVVLGIISNLEMILMSMRGCA